MVSGFNETAIAPNRFLAGQKSEGDNYGSGKRQIVHCEPREREVSYGGTKEFTPERACCGALPRSSYETRVSRVRIKSEFSRDASRNRNLLHLQEADKAIRRLQDEIAELPKRVAAIEHKLADTKLQLKKLRPPSRRMKPPRRKYDTAIADLRGKISKYRDQSLDVKTNEQYKALLHEIQFAEKEIAATEDKISS